MLRHDSLRLKPADIPDSAEVITEVSLAINFNSFFLLLLLLPHPVSIFQMLLSFFQSAFDKTGGMNFPLTRKLKANNVINKN